MKHVIAKATDILNRNEVLKLALHHGGTVFGGYLRDLVSEMEHPRSDVDVWWPEAPHAGAFVLDSAQTREIRVKRHHKDGGYGGGYGQPGWKSPGGGYGGYGKGEDFTHYRVCSMDFATYIDVVISKERSPANDVDINALVFDANGLRVEGPPGMDLNLNDVVANIKAGRFRELPDCPPHRFERMVSKGWTPSYDRS